MKIDLPIEFNDNMWMVIKDNDPQYQFLVSSDCRKIKEVFDLSFNDQKFYVLPSISLDPNEWNMLYIPQGQCKLASGCFSGRDKLNVVITGKSTLNFDYSSFGNTNKVSLILPKGMSMFEIIYIEGYSNRYSWFLIADENFDTQKIEIPHIKNRFSSSKVDFVGTLNERILVDKRYVYENGEIKNTGLTNEERDERIRKSEERIKCQKRYPNLTPCL